MVEVTRKMIDAADYYLCGYYVADDDIENAIKDAIEASDEIRRLREQRDELLEALKEAARAIDSLGYQNVSWKDVAKSQEMIYATIAKAEGKQ